MKQRCSICREEIKPNCDWNQGRCPHNQAILTDYHFRFYNLIQFFKRLFK